MPALKQDKLADHTAISPDAISAIMAQIQALNERATRIESLIRDEIRDLKAEQLADIKALIERVDKGALDAVARIGDDQRRLWEAVRALELKAERVTDIKTLADRVDTLERDRDRGWGGLKAVHYILVTAATAFGATAVAVITRLWK